MLLFITQFCEITKKCDLKMGCMTIILRHSGFSHHRIFVFFENSNHRIVPKREKAKKEKNLIFFTASYDLKIILKLYGN